MRVSGRVITPRFFLLLLPAIITALFVGFALLVRFTLRLFWFVPVRTSFWRISFVVIVRHFITHKIRAPATCRGC
jgi:hypothetical protein